MTERNVVEGKKDHVQVHPVTEDENKLVTSFDQHGKKTSTEREDFPGTSESTKKSNMRNSVHSHGSESSQDSIGSTGATRCKSPSPPRDELKIDGDVNAAVSAALAGVGSNFAEDGGEGQLVAKGKGKKKAKKNEKLLGK